MLDDSLTAEMVGILLEGIKDGGQPKIDALYKKYDKAFDADSIANLDTVLRYFVEHFADGLVGSPLLNPPHLLMLFGALSYILIGIPDGELTPNELVGLQRVMGHDLDRVRDDLQLLGAIIGADNEPLDYIEFWRASRSSTQRIASRRVRFPVYVRALSSTI
jgi:hypothetical protein